MFFAACCLALTGGGGALTQLSLCKHRCAIVYKQKLSVNGLSLNSRVVLHDRTRTNSASRIRFLLMRGRRASQANLTPRGLVPFGTRTTAWMATQIIMWACTMLDVIEYSYALQMGSAASRARRSPSSRAHAGEWLYFQPLG